MTAGRHRQAGVGFLGLLFAMALAGIALAGTGVLWQMESRREKEKELLFIGEQYRRAIASYYAATPGETKQYPQKLADLLDDKRLPGLTPARHLRRLYRDPLGDPAAPEADWELLKQQERITGVASRSRQTPIKIAGFTAAQQEFTGAASYREWKFVANGAEATPAAAQASAVPAKVNQ